MKNGPYIMVIAPAGYPGKRYRGRYAYEHQVVWWQNTGEVVPNDYLIHHKNENKHDNSFANLEKKIKADHSADHGRERRLPPVVVTCGWCSQQVEVRARDYKSRVKSGQTKFYCSRSHSAKDQNRATTEAGIAHGTQSGYRKGCKCSLCKRSHADRIAAWKRKRNIPRW